MRDYIVYFLISLVAFLIGGAIGFFSSFYWLQNKIKNMGFNEDRVREVMDFSKRFNNIDIDSNSNSNLIDWLKNNKQNMPFSF